MSTLAMIEESLRLNLAKLSCDGALIVSTGKHTGRAVKDRFVVRRPSIETRIDWGKVNQALDADLGDRFFSALQTKLTHSKTYTGRHYVGPFPVTVTSTSPWHTFFADNMFRDFPVEVLKDRFPNPQMIEIFHDPFGTVSELGISFPSDTLIAVDPATMRVGIVGTAYAGEIKKSAFSLCNFALPDHHLFPMHASANCLDDGSKSCVLFGLSGTGKTTLSESPDRYLIGDDEIIWSPTGLSNMEGGCYAKLINLDERKEPEIYHAVNRFGAIMENVGFDDHSRIVDFTDDSKTENTRGSYSLSALPNVFNQHREAAAPHTIVFLTADAFGALPAVAKLDRFQAQYHFLSGYTAKVAGTEIGIKEPQATFSACFGAPFMPQHPSVYAHLLAKFSERAGASVWILNTGWGDGGYGKADRFPIAISRALLSAIQSGALDQAPMQPHPMFGFSVPTTCPGIDSKWLHIPQGDAVAHLAEQFKANMTKFEGKIDPVIIERGGPR